MARDDHMRLIQVLVGSAFHEGPHYLTVIDDATPALDPRVQIHASEAQKLIDQGQAIWIAGSPQPLTPAEAPLVPQDQDPSA
jgi:hypothetical protein